MGIEEQIEGILGIVGQTTSLLFNGNVLVACLAKLLHKYFQTHLSALKTALGAAAAGQREEISKKRANGVLNSDFLKDEAVVQKLHDLAKSPGNENVIRTTSNYRWHDAGSEIAPKFIEVDFILL